MNRRRFVAVAALLTSSACRSSRPAVADDESIRQVIADYYDLYFTRLDKDKYRALLTRDYLLLENGEIFDADGDIAAMPKAEDAYTRSDAFEFRSVQVHADMAFAVYFLRSTVTEKQQGTRYLEWLESAVLRRTENSWRIAVLHSTRISKPTAGA
jgi:hypothetical protein